MHKGDTYHRVVLRRDREDGYASSSDERENDRDQSRSRSRSSSGRDKETDALLIDVLEDGDVEKKAKTTTSTSSSSSTPSSPSSFSSFSTSTFSDFFTEFLDWIAPRTTTTMTMTRPRTNSTAVRLPLYDSRGSRHSHPHQHQHQQHSPYHNHNTTHNSNHSGNLLCDDGCERSRSPSPTRKVRRKRSFFLRQMQYSYSSLFRSGPGPGPGLGFGLGLGRSGRSPLQCLRFAVLLILGILLFVWTFWEPHVEITFYPRSWIAREVLNVEPLAGCFDPSRVSPRYNLTQNLYAPKRTEVHSGMPMRYGMDCYDFAATIQPQAHSVPHAHSRTHTFNDHETKTETATTNERTNYHTYWRADLVPFGERQEWMVKSFFATQDLSQSRLILWSNGDLRSNALVRRWLRKYPDSFQVRIVDVDELARGTALEGSELLYAKDSKAWVDGDLVRLLVTWAYGGVWVDMDSLLTRDLSPLLEHEFVTQWDCYDKIYQPMNGAVMHFFQHSPYLCEAFSIMSRSPPPKSGTTEWGSLLYFKLWRRVLASGIPPFKILPFCFTDGRSCRLDNRLPDPFAKDKEARFWYKKSPTSLLGSTGTGRGVGVGVGGMAEGGPLDQVLGKVFSVHLHNQWHKTFPRGGWVERLLLRRYDRALGIEESPLHRAEEGFVVSKDDD